MAHSVKEITSGAAKAVGGFREALQDLLVPEIRSLKASIDGLRSEMQLRDGQQTKNLDALREELRLRTDSLKEEIRMRDTNLREELRARDEKQEQAMKNLSESWISRSTFVNGWYNLRPAFRERSRLLRKSLL